MADEGLRAVLDCLPPEAAVADRAKCGAGRGAACCVFLVIGPGGFECARQSRLRDAILERRGRMHAQRVPTIPFPDCQIKEGASDD